VGTRFSTLPDRPWAFCTMRTGSFPGLNCGRGVPRSWNSRAIPLPTLWACNGITLPLPFTQIYVHTTLYFSPCVHLRPAACLLLVCLVSRCVLIPSHFLLTLATALSGFVRLWYSAANLAGWVG